MVGQSRKEGNNIMSIFLITLFFFQILPMNTIDVEQPARAPNIDLFAPETANGEGKISTTIDVFRDKTGNVLSAERVWELSFVRSVRPDGTAVDGLDRPIERHFI